ncbi:MAG: CRTAC1 family protein, partial [Planctomycetota bacterium]|nr:CRTAC1 family protein [Planctomycetota bacterium]
MRLKYWHPALASFRPQFPQRVLCCGLVLVAAVLGCDRAPSGIPATAPADGGSGKSAEEGKKAAEKEAGTKKPGPRIPKTATGPGPIRFSEMTATSGVDFVHESGDFSEKPFPAANGSGVATLDFDLDGYVDLFFLTGSRSVFDPEWKEQPRNRCYRNRGDWKFADVTDATGLGHRGASAGVAVGDFDGDGFPDVFVNCFGADKLYRNLGDGTFRDISDPSGVSADTLWGTSAAFLDYDGDGLLDLFVVNYSTWTMETNRYCGDRSRGVRTFCSPTSVDPAPSVLYHNEGDGRLVSAGEQAGVAGRLGRGQGILVCDFNDDGWPDVYVANDMNPNFLYVNDGHGKFRDVSEASGADVDYKGASQAGMGIALADVNRDGRFDLFVTNYEGEHNAYYENQGELQFQDVSRSRGLAAESIPWVGWGTALVDFDLDGWPDCLVTNGHTDNNFHEIGRDSPYEQPPGVWHNKKGRFTFAGGDGAGAYFGALHVGRGLAVADLDNDGDQDVVIVHQDGPPAILRNDRLAGTAEDSATTSVLLIGRAGNRDAVGAVVRELEVSPARIWCQVNGGSYASASEKRVHLGKSGSAAPQSTRRISVLWPGGGRSEHTLPANSRE